MDNSLPGSTGRVCQHLSDNRCRRRTFDSAVNMREVHRSIADTIYESDRFDTVAVRIVARRLPPMDRKVAVVGGGPTGLAAAFYPALLGNDVTVYEFNREPGGCCATGPSALNRLTTNTAGSGRGPWYLAKAKALAVGLSNAYFKSLGLPSLFEDC